MFIVLKKNIRETEKANIFFILGDTGIEFHMDSQQNSSIIKIMPGFQNFPLEKIKILAGVDQVTEVHPYPERSWSDPKQALSLEQFSILMDKVNHFIEWRKQYADFTSAS